MDKIWIPSIPLYTNTCYEYVLKHVYFQYNTHYIKDGDKRLPFAFNDVMGLEAQEKGMQTKDIINALKGHLPEGYKVNQHTQMYTHANNTRP